jgi:TolB-like protein
MFRKIITVFVFFVLAVNYTVFSQTVAIDTALANATREITASVPRGTKIAVLNISSDYRKLSDYIINELTANLVNTRVFQVVPRSTIELELAQREFNFQMSGYVSDDDQKRLGRFLGAGTIISGTVTRDSANSYRLLVNAIDLESFTYQTSYRISIQNNSQLRELIAESGGLLEDYTTGERLGMGAFNIFLGLGSIVNGQKLGWGVTVVESAGIAVLAVGLLTIPDSALSGSEYVNGKSSQVRYDEMVEQRAFLITTGSIVIGGAILVGFIIPFFHHKPNSTYTSQINFPLNLELVPSNSQDINGLRISYNMKY